MSNDIFRSLYPEFCPPDGAKEFGTQFEMTVPNRDFHFKEPTVNIGSFGSPRTGHHYDDIINDDPHNEENTQNIEQIDKVIGCWEAQEPLGRGSETCRYYVATRWHYGDLNNHIMNILAPTFKDLYDRNALPFDHNDRDFGDDKLKVYLLSAEDEEGHSIWPERLNDEALAIKKAKMGAKRYAQQYLNKVIAEEEQTFKPEWFQYFDTVIRPNSRGMMQEYYAFGQEKVDEIESGQPIMADRLIPITDVTNFMTVDPAFGKKRYSDPVGIVVCGHWIDPQTRLRWLFVLDYVQRKMEISETRKVIENLYEEWNVKCVYIETHGIQGQLTEQMVRDPRWPGDNKIKFDGIRRMSENIMGKARVGRLEPYHESGRVFYARRMKGGELQKQLLAFIGGAFLGTHDDLADAFSDQVDIPFTPVKIDFMDDEASKMYGSWPAEEFEDLLHEAIPAGLDWEQI